MFQSFTGSSRRPRQVNLSGRNSNPFAATSRSTQPAVPQNAHNAVLHAQQERLARQQERERLQAAKDLQRVWRGYASRIELRSRYRRTWDEQEGLVELESNKNINVQTSSDGYRTEEEALAQLRLLVQYASPLNENDSKRVQRFGSRFCNFLSSSLSAVSTNYAWTYPLLRLATISAAMLRRAVTLPSSPPATFNRLLSLLTTVALLIPKQMALHSNVYYNTIGGLLKSSTSHEYDRRLAMEAVISLLIPRTANSVVAYEGFVSELLTVPDLQDSQGSLDDMAARLDLNLLSTALRNMLSADTPTKQLGKKAQEEILWLLSYFIYLFRACKPGSFQTSVPDAGYIHVVANILAYLAEDIRSRLDVPEGSTGYPLPAFVRSEILTLVDQQSITSLLARSGLADKLHEPRQEDTDNTATLASFALTLLRVFPKRGDDIRMWLYLGSSSRKTALNDQSFSRIPAIKYFWEAITKTGVYNSIRQHPHNAVDLLRRKSSTADTKNNQSNVVNEQEWRTVLLFLELYTFVLKVTDDEEFMSGSSMTTGEQSWTRQSALKLQEVKDLTVFLKHLAFAMYWNGAEIAGYEELVNTTSLADYFGTSNGVSTGTQSIEGSTRAEDTVIETLGGTSLNYMKGIVTGLLRMVYERDSRRSLFPKDHWLMIKYFDMEGFIPAVVMEEDYRHQMQEGDDADDDAVIPDFDDDQHDEDTLIGTHREQQIRRIERLKRQQRKTARRKHLESVTPRLEILQNMPFFIPFTTRVEIFREFVTVDQMRRRNGYIDADQWRLSVMQSSTSPDGRRTGRENLSKHHAKVRRENVFDDAFAQFYELGEGLKEPIQITFVDQFDTVEAGIDGGGVTKEFLTSVTSEAFRPATGGLNLFVENDQHLLYPNPSAVDERKDLLRQVGLKEGSPEWNEPIRDLLQRYEFLGRVIGKCLYEGILVDIHFAPFFLVKWALTGGSGSATNESGYRASINDLRDLDEELYQGLLKLKNYPGNVEDFSLDFTVTDTISAPLYGSGAGGQSSQRTITRELRPRGSDIPVTNENRLAYISYMARHRLQIQPHVQTKAFLRGLSSMIQPSWLSMFNQSELQTLIGGDSSEIDVADLRRNTLYGGVYVIGDDGQEHPTVRMFWDVMQAFSDVDRRKVLKYVTSTPRAPLLGFDQLNPRFSIRDSGSEQTRLPSTSTCVNLLKLPIYNDKRVLRDKLSYAINAGAGFNLS